jgi:hypothetical protein
MTDPIRGKVARILNSRELVLNIGSKQGVSVGMYFEVLDANGEDICDPDTGEVLGSIDRPKVRVQVTSVQESLCMASTFKKARVNIGGRGYGAVAGLSDLFQPPKYVDKYETLKTTEKTWENLSEADSYVKTGDPVVQYITEIDVGQNET